MVARQLLAFIRLGRFPFLTGGFVLHGLGAAMAVYAGAPLNGLTLLWGQVAITATQLMVHYSNEYFDLEADRANTTPTNWSGGSRVLPENHLSPSVALIAALALLLIALGATVILTRLQPAPLTLPLLGLAIGLSWFYSAPPVRLHSRGLGEAATAVIVPGLTPLTGYYLQTGTLAPLPLLVIVPLVALQFAMLLTIEFPDAQGDRAVGKRTLLVRLGERRAALLHNLILAAAYGLLPVLVAAGLPALAALLALSTLPLAAWQFWRVARGDWRLPSRWNSIAFRGVALLVGTAAATFGGFLLLIGLR